MKCKYPEIVLLSIKCIHVQCVVEALEGLEKSTALTAVPAWTRRRTNDGFTRHLPDMPVTYALQRIFAQQLPALQKQAARNCGHLYPHDTD